MIRRFCTISVAAAFLVAIPFTVRAEIPGSDNGGLYGYVKKDDPSFSWKLKDTQESLQGKVYNIDLVSQTWQGIVWKHRLQVYQPKGSTLADTMLLYNTGGGPGTASQMLALELARRIGHPIAFLFDIPNQPIYDKKEDALIAETFVRFLEGGGKDESWPLLFPMVKSLVRAMDALQAFSDKEWQRPLKQFVVTGGSKRGWTSWLTGAADPRVKAIAPLVIDTLNMHPQMKHQLEMFGKPSEMIHDYVERKLVPAPDTPEAQRLWKMIDPYFYLDRLTMPKLLVNGGNDPYWTVDALNLYWNDLKGDKYVLIVPNAGHDLRQLTGGTKDLANRAVAAISIFAKAQIDGKPLPKMEWRHADVENQMRLSITTDTRPAAARLWVIDSETKDFRKSTWKEKETEISADGKRVLGFVEPPVNGFRAFYGEVEFDSEGSKYSLSTQVRVAGGK
ncbi:MAG TPA: PhoPQ-activated protein PqaA family protein [Gemmataceae bacterium]|jgi:PhoPQ-activated pathogenicity-related protein|nr:PhoPQ-activated protein PqaA family protein [Gemmataceae bacterium]